MNSDAITIITPIYNLEKYLKSFFDSLLKQTFQEFKVICVDDCSTDNSLEILKEYQSCYPQKINVIENKTNKGAGLSRDVGLLKGIIQTKYLMFLDADDTFEIDYFEKMVNAGEAYDVDIVICGFDRIDCETNKVYSKEMIKNNPEYLEKLSDTDTMAYINPAPWNKLFRTDLISKDICFGDIRTGEDLCFLLKIFPHVSSVFFVNEILYHYSVRYNSLMNTMSINDYEVFWKESLKIKELYSKYMNYSAYLEVLELIMFIHLGISYTYRLVGQEKNKKQYIDMTRENLDAAFPGWRNNKYLSFAHSVKRGIKGIGLWGCRVLYKINLFGIFISIYTFIIKKMKIDIKW